MYQNFQNFLMGTNINMPTASVMGGAKNTSLKLGVIPHHRDVANSCTPLRGE